MRRLRKYTIITANDHMSVWGYGKCVAYMERYSDRIVYYNAKGYSYFGANISKDGPHVITLISRDNLHRFEYVVYRSSYECDLTIDRFPSPKEAENFRYFLEIVIANGRFVSKNIKETGATLETVRKFIWQN